MTPEKENLSEEILFVVEKLYEDGWKWYCGYDTFEEAKERSKIVEERDKRPVRIRRFIEIKEGEYYGEHYPMS